MLLAGVDPADAHHGAVESIRGILSLVARARGAT